MKNPIIVTGATGSMGAVACRVLASEGYPVIMACRNLERGEELRQSILVKNPEAQLELMLLNLDSRAGVMEFVGKLQGRTFAGIFNNAGTTCRHRTVTEDGFEKTMAVNYLMPCLLTRLLIPQFENGAHIVNMVSLTTKFARLDLDWQSAPFSQLGTYGSSKVALLLFSIALARRCPHLHVNVSDPGIVNSRIITLDRWFDPLADLIFRPFISSPEKGAQPALRALHYDGSFRYFVGKGSKPISRRFMNSPLVDSLWEQAEELLQIG